MAKRKSKGGKRGKSSRGKSPSRSVSTNRVEPLRSDLSEQATGGGVVHTESDPVVDGDDNTVRSGYLQVDSSSVDGVGGDDAYNGNSQEQAIEPTYLSSSNEKALRAFERVAGRELSSVLDLVDEMASDPGFGGLLEVPEGVSRELSGLWVKRLSELNALGAYRGSVPKAFMVRMLEDGSLVLKAIPLPSGIVFASDVDVSRSHRAVKHATDAVSCGGEVVSNNEVAARPDENLRTLALGPNGDVVVK